MNLHSDLYTKTIDGNYFNPNTNTMLRIDIKPEHYIPEIEVYQFDTYYQNRMYSVNIFSGSITDSVPILLFRGRLSDCIKATDNFFLRHFYNSDRSKDELTQYTEYANYIYSFDGFHYKRIDSFSFIITAKSFETAKLIADITLRNFLFSPELQKTTLIDYGYYNDNGTKVSSVMFDNKIINNEWISTNKTYWQRTWTILSKNDKIQQYKQVISLL